jgi:hypothetical protein
MATSIETPSVSEVPVIEMRGITKSFPGVLANDHVDFTLGRGEIHALLGENGPGKARWERPDGAIPPRWGSDPGERQTRLVFIPRRCHQLELGWFTNTSC